MLNRLRKTLIRALGGGGRRRPSSVEQAEAMLSRIRARYDAAQTTDEFKNYWVNADHYDADSAHSRDVRHTLIARSRYEIGNNGYADGIAHTYATDMVGTGPLLRMQTGAVGFNQMIEKEWSLFCKAIGFRRKLWCMTHAKHSDGEGFAVIRRNPMSKYPIPIDLSLHESEQFQTPLLSFTEPGYIDGIKFDEFGNRLWYDLLRQHPGRGLQTLSPEPEKVPARFVLHWFKLRRPGQHRAVPEMSSTLNVGAAARRWREATLACAEQCADYTFLMKTQMTPDEADAVAPFSTMDVSKRMMGFLPAGWDPFQPDAKFPSATQESFHKSLVNEQARPKSMPYNKAACDSSSYNFASGRLDHQTYYGELDVDREDCNDLVLDPLFDLWLDLAIARFGWLGGNPEAVGPGARQHSWDWPQHAVADIATEASANQTKLVTGQLSLSRLYSEMGLDLEDEIPVWAATFGVPEDEIRKRLLDITLPAPVVGGAPPEDPAAAPADAADPADPVAAMLRSRLTQTNGAHHAKS